MGSLDVINYKNKEIIRLRYADLSEEEILQFLDNAYKMIVNKQEKCLLLANWEQAFVTAKVKKFIDDNAEMTNMKVEKTAVVGVTGVKKIFNSLFAKILKMPLKMFNTEDEAMNWLVD